MIKKIKIYTLIYETQHAHPYKTIYAYATERESDGKIITTIQEDYINSLTAKAFHGTYEEWKQKNIIDNEYIEFISEEFIEHIEKVRIDENTRTHEEFDAQGNTIFWSKEIIRNYTSVSGIDGQLWTRTEKTSDKIE